MVIEVGFLNHSYQTEGNVHMKVGTHFYFSIYSSVKMSDWELPEHWLHRNKELMWSLVLIPGNSEWGSLHGHNGDSNTTYSYAYEDKTWQDLLDVYLFTVQGQSKYPTDFSYFLIV